MSYCNSIGYLFISHLFCCDFQIQGYTKAVEEFIEEELEKRIPEFNMRSFIQGKYLFIQQNEFMNI